MEQSLYLKLLAKWKVETIRTLIDIETTIGSLSKEEQNVVDDESERLIEGMRG